MAVASQVIPACDIDRVLAQYQHRCAETEKVFAAVRAYEDQFSGARLLDRDVSLEKELRHCAAVAWTELMDKSGMLTFMSADARREWHYQLNDIAKPLPDLTHDNIAATFESLIARREEFFVDGVEKVFRRLSWDYKSNSPRGFGKRIVISRLVCSYGFFDHSQCNALDDLRRVLDMTAGRPEVDHRDGYYSKLTSGKRFRAFDDGKPVKEQEIVDDVLRIRWHKNGNGHVYFVEPDGADRLNRIMARRSKTMLFDEERSGRKW